MGRMDVNCISGQGRYPVSSVLISSANLRKWRDNRRGHMVFALARETSCGISWGISWLSLEQGAGRSCKLILEQQPLAVLLGQTMTNSGLQETQRVVINPHS